MGTYLDTRSERAGRYRSTDRLFVRRLRGAYVPFNAQAMDALVAGWYRRAGVTPPPGSLAHALRHTYATLLVDAEWARPGFYREFEASPTNEFDSLVLMKHTRRTSAAVTLVATKWQPRGTTSGREALPPDLDPARDQPRRRRAPPADGPLPLWA